MNSANYSKFIRTQIDVSASNSLCVLIILNNFHVVLPSTRLVKYNGIKPEINAAFVASDATVVGNVKIGVNSSVWYGSVIRGIYDNFILSLICSHDIIL